MQLDEEQPSSILVSPTKELEGPLYAILHPAPIPAAAIVPIIPPRRERVGEGFEERKEEKQRDQTAQIAIT
nr:unnamed protein product [Callosobruchus chinensis]